MASRFKFRKRKLDLPVQHYSMTVSFPNFSYAKKNNVGEWIGVLQPTPLSEKYTIKIRYSLNDSPKVWVLSPILTPRDGVPIPHTYGENRLCLYLPGAGEWSSDMLIAKTIVPWTSLWLYYYEMWHATGEWLGGGVHPLRNKPKEEDNG